MAPKVQKRTMELQGETMSTLQDKPKNENEWVHAHPPITVSQAARPPSGKAGGADGGVSLEDSASTSTELAGRAEGSSMTFSESSMAVS